MTKVGWKVAEALPPVGHATTMEVAVSVSVSSAPVAVSATLADVVVPRVMMIGLGVVWASAALSAALTPALTPTLAPTPTPTLAVANVSVAEMV